jgi:nucleotide-binding universal stress UspA family protein
MVIARRNSASGGETRVPSYGGFQPGVLPPFDAKELIVSTVMLALSTFRHSEEAVSLALDRAESGGQLIITYIVDINLARYFIGSDVGLYEKLKSRCEQEILDEHRRTARSRVKEIVRRAEARSMSVKVHVRTGRFALKSLELARTYRPELIITTRSKRPQWVKQFFGSPVDMLIDRAPCPVIEA